MICLYGILPYCMRGSIMDSLLNAKDRIIVNPLSLIAVIMVVSLFSIIHQCYIESNKVVKMTCKHQLRWQWGEPLGELILACKCPGLDPEVEQSKCWRAINRVQRTSLVHINILITLNFKPQLWITKFKFKLNLDLQLQI